MSAPLLIAPLFMPSIVKVWDLPTRLFHWLLILSLSGSLLSVFYIKNMDWHGLCGYSVLVLLLFRLFWGFAGGHWSRFSSFIPSVQQSLAYIRQPAAWQQPGHNPLAAWSVWAILLVLMCQVASGLCADDDAGFSGPLTVFVSNRNVEIFTFYHADIGKWLLCFLTGLHIAAVLFHIFYKRQPLLHAMLTGFRQLPHHSAIASDDNAWQRLKALWIFALCTALVYAAVHWLQTRLAA